MLGFLIKCHGQQNKIKHIKILIMICADHGNQVICLQEISIVREHILLNVQVVELLKDRQVDPIGESQKKNSGNLIEIIEFGGEKTEIMFLQLRGFYLRLLMVLFLKRTGPMKK